MKIAVVTDPGCEDLLKIENDKFVINDFYGEIDFSEAELVNFVYTSQLASRVLLKTSSGKFKDFDDLLKKIKLIPCNRIRCDRKGLHHFRSVDIQASLENKKEKGELDFRVIIRDDKFVAGLDLAGRDLSKRQYRVFNHPNNIKGSLAAAALYFANAKTPFLDPLGLSGTIAIEMALKESKTSVNYYNKNFDFFKLKNFKPHENILNKIDEKKIKIKDIHSYDPKFKNLAAQKKNAKIAGVDKFIDFARCELSYLDIKHEKINSIVTLPIEPSKKLAEKRAIELNNVLLKQSSLLLTNDEGLTLITKKPVFIEKTLTGFEIIDKKKVLQGEVEYYFLKLRRL